MFKFRRAFTLVELLVVISIIGILVAMLLPALSKAREATTHVRCAAQLHQQGVSMSAYQADNRNYYPSFGGAAAIGYAGWLYTPGLGQVFTFDDNTGTRSYFGSYLNGGNPVNRKLQQVNYCPAIDWNNWGPYSFDNGGYYGYFQTALPVGWAGYNFYPGRKFYDPAGTLVYDYDTRRRRDDPKEILATDLVEEVMPYCGFWHSVYNGQSIDRSPSVPWFNPHSGNCNTTSRQGEFHQLVASGAVAQYRYADPNTTPTFSYSSACLYMFANARIVNASASGMTDGGYFQGY